MMGIATKARQDALCAAAVERLELLVIRMHLVITIGVYRKPQHPKKLARSADVRICTLFRIKCFPSVHCNDPSMQDSMP